MKARNGGCGYHDEQRREKPAQPELIKSQERKAVALDFCANAACNQISGDDKENIDADKAAVDPRYLEMEGDDCHHGNRAQPVDILAIAARHVGCLFPFRRRGSPDEFASPMIVAVKAPAAKRALLGSVTPNST